MDEPLLTVRNLRVEFPTRRGVLVAVDNVSFDIDRGEILGVVGESGAGKSMTGAAIIGLLEAPGRIASGEIWLEGARIDHLYPWRERMPVAGEVPNPIDPPPGYGFNPRCPFANERCRREQPELRAVENTMVACHAIEEN